MLSVIETGKQHIELIRGLCFMVWPPTYTPILGTEQVNYMLDLFYSPAALEQQIEVLKHKFLLASMEDIPVGFASYSEIQAAVYKLHKLYTLPQYQGMGIGKFVLDNIICNIKSSGGISLRLNVNRYNDPAIAFYKKYGFTVMSVEDIDIGNGYFMNDYVLSKDLNN